MASHQYPYGEDMPPEDFWNIVGRAGRIGQGRLGIVALVANNQDKAKILRGFINAQGGELNSALIRMTVEAQSFLGDLGGIVYKIPEWSSFLQYLAHTYRQMGEPESFIDQIEQVLRGTLGFEKLRSQNPSIANQLLGGIHNYLQYLQRPGQPLKLVDSTGFSLQSINTVLTNKGDISSSSWDSNTLFRNDNQTLQKMMGVLLKVPELRENLEAATGGNSPNGKKLALIIKDWVNGVSVSEIATHYFMKEGDDLTKAMTKCGQNLFGKLTQTASWGLGALLSITGSNLPEDQLKILRNLPSQVYYGVNSDAAIVLRLLGVSREAASPLANVMGAVLSQPVTAIREQLKGMNESDWNRALGEKKGVIYRKVWRILEGIE
jgi:replicative superfamily II helicase